MDKVFDPVCGKLVPRELLIDGSHRQKCYVVDETYGFSDSNGRPMSVTNGQVSAVQAPQPRQTVTPPEEAA